MCDKVFIDTNVLIYLADRDSSFHDKAVEIFMPLTEKYEIWISRQVLREYAVVVSRKDLIEKPLKAKAITDDIGRWEKVFRIADENWQVTSSLKDLISQYNMEGKRIHDANIVASMIRYSIPILFTFNVKDFKNFDGIELVDIE